VHGAAKVSWHFILVVYPLSSVANLSCRGGCGGGAEGAEGKASHRWKMIKEDVLPAADRSAAKVRGWASAVGGGVRSCLGAQEAASSAWGWTSTFPNCEDGTRFDR